jgi:uncharacterized protein
MRCFSVCAVLVLVCSANFCAAEETKERSISTSGEAVVYVQPDEVVLQFGVETRDQSLDKAESLNNEAATKLVAAVKQLGVDERQISSSNLNVQILYVNNVNLEIRGYEVARSYSVTLKDPSKSQELVDTVIKHGANRINGLDFRTKELRKFRDQARAMAIKAAKEKAEALAGELKCKVGNPRTISETGGNFGYWGGANGSFNAMTQNMAQVAPSSGDADESGSVQLGQIAVRANVSATFDLLVQ